MKQTSLIVIVAIAVATGTIWIQNIEYALLTGKLIDTSTGEGTELRAGTVGETAPGNSWRA